MDAHPSELRRLRQREQARRAILDASEALLVEGGHERLSMRRLAEACGYTAPTIYHYFEDKQGVIDALLEERFSRLYRTLRRLPSNEDPVQRLRGLALAFIRFGLRNPAHYRLLMTRDLGSEQDRPPSVEKCLALFDEVMSRLERERRLLVTDRRAAQQTVWAAVHGLISLRASRPDHDWTRDLPEAAIEVVLRGLITQPARAERGEAR
jgi:AcrR family transcriptional regulator